MRVERKISQREHNERTFMAFDVIFDEYNREHIDTKHMKNICRLLYKKLRLTQSQSIVQ
jgi:hypothetical protein